MRISVRVNGILAQRIGIARFPVTLPAGATVQLLLLHLQDRYPDSSAEIMRAVPVIAGVHRPTTTVLRSEEEVALLMPIAGG